MADDLDTLRRFLLYEELPAQGFDVKELLIEAADHFRGLEFVEILKKLPQEQT